MMRVKTLIILCMLPAKQLGATDLCANAERQVAKNKSLACPPAANVECTRLDIGQMSYPVVPYEPSEQYAQEKHFTSHLSSPLTSKTVFAQTLLMAHKQAISSYQKSLLLSRNLNYLLERMEQFEQRTLSRLKALEASVSLSVQQTVRNRLQISAELTQTVDVSENAAERDRVLGLIDSYLHEGPLQFAKDYIVRYWEHFVEYLYEVFE